jgi:hypothetical protein
MGAQPRQCCGKKPEHNSPTSVGGPERVRCQQVVTQLQDRLRTKLLNKVGTASALGRNPPAPNLSFAKSSVEEVIKFRNYNFIPWLRVVYKEDVKIISPNLGQASFQAPSRRTCVVTPRSIQCLSPPLDRGSYGGKASDDSPSRTLKASQPCH